MKKKVKSLIIAASVAAIAGIGAVSFAAWQGGGATPVDKTGATGEVDTLGAITVTSNLDGKTLLPYDQAGTLTATQIKIWQLDLEVVSTGAAATFEVKLGTADTDDLGSGKLYIFTGETYADPTTDTAATGAPTDWTALTTTATEIKADENGEATAYIILVSNSTDDMNKNFKVTVSATQTTTAA